jgi:hypothetical protein
LVYPETLRNNLEVEEWVKMKGSHKNECLKYPEYSQFPFFLKLVLGVNGRSPWEMAGNITEVHFKT